MAAAVTTNLTKTSLAANKSGIPFAVHARWFHQGMRIGAFKEL